MFESKVSRFVFLNGATWRFFDFAEPENPLSKGEKVCAFRNPVTKTIDVKFFLHGKNL